MTYNIVLMKRPGFDRGAPPTARRGTILDEAMSRPTLEVKDRYQDPRWDNGDRDPYRLPSKGISND